MLTLQQKVTKLSLLRKILMENPTNFVELVNSNFDIENGSILAKKRNVAVEFSSPNIAKPFHVGHLRSTFLGRFLSNIIQSNGSSVTRINYLGDWGNQFGFLAAGFEKFGDESLLQLKKLLHLYDVYVKANAESEKNKEFGVKAQTFFSLMENGDEQALNFWRKCREISIVELTDFYKALNVHFDMWQAESLFAEKARRLIDLYLSKNIFVRLDNGVVGIKQDPSPNSDKEFRFVTLAKSDGTSLYLTRDVVGAIERVDSMSFDHIYYVVDQGQMYHFINLKDVLTAIGREDVAQRISHVPFGIIRDMSTRQGKVVFVQDMIAQGEQIAYDILKSSPTTKIAESEFASASRELALSAFIVNDMKQKRLKSYSYDWEKILSRSGDGGYLLHAAHARLNSLENKCVNWMKMLDDSTGFELDWSKLDDEHAVALISHLVEKLQPALARSLDRLEPVYVVNYLIQLCHLSNVAYKHLRVSDVEEEVGRARLLLFSTTKLLLAACMRLLGISPLLKL